jgi:hypothetical protein
MQQSGSHVQVPLSVEGKIGAVPMERNVWEKLSVYKNTQNEIVCMLIICRIKFSIYG